MSAATAARPTRVFVVVHALGSGGITHAALDQCNMFAAAGCPVTLVTLTDEPEGPQIARLRAQGRLTAEIEVRNPHDDLRALWAKVPAIDDPTGFERLLARTDLWVEGRGRAPGLERRYTSDGSYVAHVRRDDDGEVVTVGYHREREVGVREHWSDGRVRFVEHLSRAGKRDREAWYTPNGHPYLTRTAEPVSGRGAGLMVQAPGAEARHHRDSFTWHVAWLEQVLGEAGEGAVALANTASTVTKLARVRGTGARLFGMLHHCQYDAPFTQESPLRKDDQRVFRHVEGLDGLVVLTEPQRRDMEGLIGHKVPVRAVPNTTRVPDLPEIEKDPRLVTTFARIEPQKALHEAIHAWARVVEEVPDARFEIYGRGRSMPELKALVAELGLEASVLFPGRTPEPHAVMARSVCTLSTSDWEAMPLSIMESQASGTPVVAYDCLYGPATLIEDGITGRLLDRGDREGVARAVVELLRDPDRAAEMGRAARQRIEERYAAPVVARQWEKVFAAV